MIIICRESISVLPTGNVKADLSHANAGKLSAELETMQDIRIEVLQVTYQMHYLGCVITSLLCLSELHWYHNLFIISLTDSKYKLSQQCSRSQFSFSNCMYIRMWEWYMYFTVILATQVFVISTITWYPPHSLQIKSQDNCDIKWSSPWANADKFLSLLYSVLHLEVQYTANMQNITKVTTLYLYFSYNILYF